MAKTWKLWCDTGAGDTSKQPQSAPLWEAKRERTSTAKRDLSAESSSGLPIQYASTTRASRGSALARGGDDLEVGPGTVEALRTLSDDGVTAPGSYLQELCTITDAAVAELVRGIRVTGEELRTGEPRDFAQQILGRKRLGRSVVSERQGRGLTNSFTSTTDVPRQASSVRTPTHPPSPARVAT
jgi:hypothetical protein